MTIESSELFELCRSVYEVTGWKYTIGRFHDDGSYDGYVGHGGVAYMPNPQDAEWLPKNIPLYTSDYLLDKLPDTIGLYREEMSHTKWTAAVEDGISFKGVHVECGDDECECDSYFGEADTPLKALLKLTLKLHEEGLL